MTNGYVGADGQRKAGIGVKHGVVLDVTAVADLDRVVVAAKDGPGPDADLFAQSYLADYRRAVCNVGRTWNMRRIIAELIDCHCQLCKCFLKKSSVFPHASLAASGWWRSDVSV